MVLATLVFLWNSIMKSPGEGELSKFGTSPDIAIHMIQEVIFLSGINFLQGQLHYNLH